MGLQGDMTGKTVLIAGTTDGIGKETARQLAAMGARELIHGRCGEKADRVRKAIIPGLWQRSGGCPDCRPG